MYSIDGSSGVLTTLGTVRARPGARAIAMSGGTAAVTYTPKFAYAANAVSNMFRCTQSMQPPEL